MKDIVIPGEKVSDSPLKISGGAYRKDGSVYAKYLGILYKNEVGVSVVPLNGSYVPRVGDVIIGIVTGESLYDYNLDMNYYNHGRLNKRDSPGILKINDVLLLRVAEVNEIKQVTIECIRKLEAGTLFNVNPRKIARIVGKNRSMLSAIEKHTGSKLIVGSNGFIFGAEGNLDVVKETLEKIQQYSHVDELTKKMEEILIKKSE
jgi:exosome complex component RRP4